MNFLWRKELVAGLETFCQYTVYISLLASVTTYPKLDGLKQ